MSYTKSYLLGMGIIIVLTCYPLRVAADDMVLDGGLGVFDSAKNSLSETKLLKVGIQEDLWYVLKQRFNTGFWLDNAGNGRTGSSFIGYQLGYEVKTDSLVASAWTGPGLISSPDSYLGGMLQFNETMFFGIHDKQDNTMGFAYNHWSSAGIEMPNQGRDFVTLQLKFPVW